MTSAAAVCDSCTCLTWSNNSRLHNNTISTIRSDYDSCNDYDNIYDIISHIINNPCYEYVRPSRELLNDELLENNNSRKTQLQFLLDCIFLSLKLLLVVSLLSISPTDFQTSVFIPEIVSRPNLRRQSYCNDATRNGARWLSAINTLGSKVYVDATNIYKSYI